MRFRVRVNGEYPNVLLDDVASRCVPKKKARPALMFVLLGTAAFLAFIRLFHKEKLDRQDTSVV